MLIPKSADSLRRGAVHLSEFNVDLNAAERIFEYTEAAEQEPDDGLLPPAAWPSHDSLIQFEALSMRYRPELPLVLKDVSFTIKPLERVAIVGRTGSGKSTLVQAFFRFLENDRGRILIDGIDIATLDLAALRDKLTIIPQDATLFENTLRFNLDPFDRASDAELWQALQAVDLAGRPTSRIKTLDMEVQENGSNFSAGERQLIALARGLVRGIACVCGPANSLAGPLARIRISHSGRSFGFARPRYRRHHPEDDTQGDHRLAAVHRPPPQYDRRL
jgi:ABC-type multidrug transport system fused ATPase/permease subunit